MTYLDAINKVLRRLREDEVTSVTANAYSKLIGEYINDAKRLVEDAWDWQALRETVVLSTVAGTTDYTLTGLNSSFKTLSVLNTTGSNELYAADNQWINKQVYLNSAGGSTGTPAYYAYTGFTDSGDATVTVYPKPDKVYDIRFNVVNRTEDFTLGTELLKVVPSAVVQYATGFAMEERGETGGQSGSSLLGQAKYTLGDAISLDAARFPLETIWVNY